MDEAKKSVSYDEKVEMDTVDAEDTYDLNALLLPDASNFRLPSYDRFSVSYSLAALNGWVKQPSPCCAAASVAGAWNAIHRLSRSDQNALHHTDVIQILKEILEHQIQSKQGRFERLLGASIEPLIQGLEDFLFEKGYPRVPKKGEAPKRKVLLNALRELVLTQAQQAEPEAVYSLMAELYSDQNQENVSEELTSTDEGNDLEDDEEKEDEDHEVIPERHGSIPSNWKWKMELLEILKKRNGINKLCGESPSTAAFGNWGVIEAIRRLSNQNGECYSPLKASLFAGHARTSKSKLPIPITRKDSEQVIENQWALLRSAFLQDSTALIFHLKNHYALVFALREWSDSCIQEDGSTKVVHVKEMLTAKKGQRPSAWISWKESREIMLSWDGYKIMIVEIQY